MAASLKYPTDSQYYGLENNRDSYCVYKHYNPDTVQYFYTVDCWIDWQQDDPNAAEIYHHGTKRYTTIDKAHAAAAVTITYDRNRIPLVLAERERKQRAR